MRRRTDGALPTLSRMYFLEMCHTKTMLKLTVYVQVLMTVSVWTQPSLCRSQAYYIWPSVDCYSKPCLTLEQFATGASINSSAKWIKMTLAPGNHSLSSELLLENLEYFSLIATSDTEETRIICNSSGRLGLLNISESLIDGIEFLDCQSTSAMDLKNLTISNCEFLLGGIGPLPLLELNRTKVLFKNSSFTKNISDAIECAFLSRASNITFEASNLTSNGATILLAESESIVQIKNTSIIDSVTHRAWLKTPSALIQISNGKLLIENSKIIENKGEMIVYARHCTVSIHNSTLDNNFGADCILCIVKSTVFLNDTMISNNTGNFSIIYLLKTGTNITGRMVFSNNFGSLLIINSNVQFYGLTMFETCSQPHVVPKHGRLQPQGTLTTIQSTLVFWKTVTFRDNNSTNSGGAIFSSVSKITIHYHLSVANNTAHNSGGGAFLYLSTFVCHGSCIFKANVAHAKGGGIRAVSSVIILTNGTQELHQTHASITLLSFVANEAESGGALYLEVNSYLNCIVDRINNYSIVFDGNRARKKGGAIFIRDRTYYRTCGSKSSYVHHPRTECFFQITYNDIDVKKPKQKQRLITFINNTAERGRVLYGGLLDRCSLSPMADIYDTDTHKSISGFEYFRNESGGTVESDDIESGAMRICNCSVSDNESFTCQDQGSISVHKGEVFNVSVMVINQVNRTIINTTIRSELREESILGEGQQLQHTEGSCTNLTFSVISPFESADLTLYADQGPCKDKGISRFLLQITFKNCTCYIGFLQSNDSRKCQCDLDPQLYEYVKVFNTSSVVRTRNCWINYIIDGDRYEYIIHPYCPYDYCLLPSPTDTTIGIITLNETNGADAQCNFNRAGLLCGQCKQGYSLSLGSTYCVQCPKYWPGLVAGNIVMGIVCGIAMVILLLLLNLTVAVGTTNGIIFYANVVLINKSIFLPSSAKQFNLFTVVIFLLNTQIEMKRCFWEGMTAYGKTWLSYVFPLYMISLVIAIIVISKYSPRCAHLLGQRNPVATLATLILFSYAYFLRSILDIFSFTIINYPNGTRKIVWLPDASVEFFQGKHIPLFLSAVILTTAGLAYTILLFGWQWLLKLPNISIFRWLSNAKLNSFIEAYHAPYKGKYRYWTGLLLFIRIALSVAITANVSGDPQYNLLATGILVTCLIALKVYLGNHIYKNKAIDYLENACYLNLLILTIVTFYYLRNETVHKNATYTSIGVILILSLCVITYHTYSALRKSPKCQKVFKLVIQRCRTGTTHAQHSDMNVTTFNRCGSTEVSMAALATSQHEEEEMADEKNEKTYEAVVCTLEQEAHTPDSLFEPLL